MSNPHCEHIANLDPHLGALLAQFLSEEHIISNAPQLCQKVVPPTSVDEFGEKFSKVLQHIDATELVLQWNRQDMLGNIKSLALVAQQPTLPAEWVNQLFNYAQSTVYNEQKDYKRAKKLLIAVLGLVPQYSELYLAAFWGVLQCQILLSEWEAAWDSVMTIDGFLNGLSSGRMQGSGGSLSGNFNIHKQQEWLMTASLFVLSRHVNGPSLGADFFHQSSHINTILCGYPNLFRYVAFFVMINKKRKFYMNDIYRFLQNSTISTSTLSEDPIIQLMYRIIVQLDFEPSSTYSALKSSQTAVNQDYFLRPYERDWIESVRSFIFETYSRLHYQIQLGSLCHRLGLSFQTTEFPTLLKDDVDGEQWIANMIQRIKLDAKIDSERGVLLIRPRSTIPYQQVIEKTKSQNLRTQMMTFHLGGNSASTLISDSQVLRPAHRTFN